MVGATRNFARVADTVSVDIGSAGSSADADGVFNVAVAVAISSRDFSTSAIVDGTWAIANAASVHCADTRIDVVTNAVAVCICSAGSSADANGVFLVTVTVAITSRDFCATAFENGTRSVANTTSIRGSHAVVYVITNAIAVGVCCTITTANADGVFLVSIAVAVTRRNIIASTFVDRTGTVANTTSVRGSHTVVYVVTNAIAIRINGAITTTFANDVFHIAIAVAVSSGNIGTPTFVDGAWAIANSTGVEGSNAVVYVVTNAVAVCICCAGSSADANGVFLVTVTVAITGRDFCATAFENGAWAIANSAGVEGSNAVVHIVADVVVVCISSAITTANAQGVFLVSIAVAITRRNVIASTFVDRTWSITHTAGILK